MKPDFFPWILTLQRFNKELNYLYCQQSQKSACVVKVAVQMRNSTIMGSKMRTAPSAGAGAGLRILLCMPSHPVWSYQSPLAALHVAYSLSGITVTVGYG